MSEGIPYARLAQMVEQRIENPKITGSNPVERTITKHSHLYHRFLYIGNTKCYSRVRSSGQCPERIKDMIAVQFTLSCKEHMELRQSSFRYLDRLCARSFKVKWDNSIIL